MTVILRPPSLEDAAAVADVLNRFNHAAEIDEESTAEIEMWFTAPGTDIENDARVALVDGEIVGYADVSDHAREGKVLWTDVRSDPVHTDAMPVLLEFTEQRARELAASSSARIKAWAPEKARALRDLLESSDYRFYSYSFQMVIDLQQEPPEPQWPQGISVRSYRQDEDERAVYDAHQEAFAEERDFVGDPFDEWKHWSYRDPFDPGLWFLALDRREIAGIALCRSEWGGDADLGWVSILGVRKPWRRRGVGLALLGHVFRELRARGKRRVGLGVNSENPTGAVRLYERAGMVVERKSLRYEKDI